MSGQERIRFRFCSTPKQPMPNINLFCLQINPKRKTVSLVTRSKDCLQLYFLFFTFPLGSHPRKCWLEEKGLCSIGWNSFRRDSTEQFYLCCPCVRYFRRTEIQKPVHCFSSCKFLLTFLGNIPNRTACGLKIQHERQIWTETSPIESFQESKKFLFR